MRNVAFYRVSRPCKRCLGGTEWELPLRVRLDLSLLCCLSHSSAAHPHGKGVHYYHDKEGYKRYEGDVSQGNPHGNGIYYFKNNTKQYEGHWSQNKWHGKGVEYYGKNNNNKKKKEGLWSQGEFKSGTFFDKEGIEFLSKDLVKDLVKLQKLASLLNVHRRTSKRTRKTIKVTKP